MENSNCIEIYKLKPKKKRKNKKEEEETETRKGGKIVSSPSLAKKKYRIVSISPLCLNQ